MRGTCDPALITGRWAGAALGLACFGLTLGCGAHRSGLAAHAAAPVTKAAPPGQADYAAAIKARIDPYLDPRATAAGLAARLGHSVEPPGDRTLSVAPPDRRFQQIDLGLEPDPRGSQFPYVMDLTLARSPPLRVADMDRAFGKSRPVSPPPEGNPFRLGYTYAPPASPYRAELIVDLTLDPSDAGARVTEISVQRFRVHRAKSCRVN